MKKLLLSLIVIATFSMTSLAQTIQNFNMADTKGTVHNLYTYLGAGDAVVLEFFQLS